MLARRRLPPEYAYRDKAHSGRLRHSPRRAASGIAASSPGWIKAISAASPTASSAAIPIISTLILFSFENASTSPFFDLPPSVSTVQSFPAILVLLPVSPEEGISGEQRLRHITKIHEVAGNFTPGRSRKRPARSFLRRPLQHLWRAAFVPAPDDPGGAERSQAYNRPRNKQHPAAQAKEL